MMFSKIKNFSGTIAAAILIAVCIATPARAQSGGLNVQTLPATATSTDGLLTMTMSSTNSSDAVDVNNTFTWTVTNNSPTQTLGGVILGSHWGDFCLNITATTIHCNLAPPTGPTLISLTPGCGSQSAADFDNTLSRFGIWCTPSSGVTLLPGASVSGSVTVRPGTGGPVLYGVYTNHTPLPGERPQVDTAINYRGMVAPLPTDIQMTGSASTGSPSAGSTFTYTYQIKNAGPWGTFGGITFVDRLPASLTYVNSSVAQAGIDSSTGQLQILPNLKGCSAVMSLIDGTTDITCPLNDLTDGGLSNQATITLTVTASGAPQRIANTATVHTAPVTAAGPQDDSNPNNNSVTVNVTSKL
jgi:uncharacterized repeat protein (TIGR01451 family)